MCAIVGYLSLTAPVDRATFAEMRDCMRHRGPDGAGTEFRLNARVALGHRRLAIVDLSDRAKQPIANEDGSVWLVFNGEIYNFRELRSELEQLGHRFRSDGDSEVILHGYESWGTGVLERLEGMFAFAVWDETNDTLILARDRFGIKPLHYYVEHDKLIFASELKGILADPTVPRAIDWVSAADYFVYRFVPSPRSIWKRIHKLPRAQFIEYHRASGRLECRPYWTPNLANRSMPTEDAVERSKELLFASVRQHLRCDVPRGLFLSGGLDSTTLLLIAAGMDERLCSFTLGFSGSTRSEHSLANQVAETFAAEHRQLMAGDQLHNLGERMAFFVDEPLGDSSLLPTFLISEFASKTVKVVLAGDGGDEAFAGYAWHRQLYDRLHPRSWKGRLNRIVRRWRGAPDLASSYHELTSWTGWSYADLATVLDPDLIACEPERGDDWLYRRLLPDGPVSPIKTFQSLDYDVVLSEVFLTKVDRASMAHSLEVRVPFLDRNLVEFMMGLDESVYFDRDCKKLLLYRFLENKVPPSILRHPKQGFSVPMTHFLTIEKLESCLREGELLRRGILQAKAITRLAKERSRMRLWALCQFEWWFQKWAMGDG